MNKHFLWTVGWQFLYDRNELITTAVQKPRCTYVHNIGQVRLGYSFERITYMPNIQLRVNVAKLSYISWCPYMRTRSVSFGYKVISSDEKFSAGVLRER